MANHLLQTDIPLTVTDDSSQDPDLLLVAKRLVQLKLAACALESDVPRQAGSDTEGDTPAETMDIHDNKSSYIPNALSVTILPETKQYVELEQEGTSNTCDVKNEPKETIGLDHIVKQDDISTRSERHSELKLSNSELRAEMSIEIVTRSKTKAKGEILSRKMKQKPSKMKGSKPRTKPKRKIKKKKVETVVNDSDAEVTDLAPGERLPDWTLHKGGDWHPDK